MIWHEASGTQIAEFGKTCDVALIPVGCVEMHGPHNPTGCDALIADRVCRLTAEVEPCLVLPPIFYNINDQMKCYPGTISIPHRILTDLYRAIFRECARNGFRRIVVYVAHGGGQEPLITAQAEVLDEGVTDYQVFRVESWALRVEGRPEGYGGHGGAGETSCVWDAAPGTVDLSRVGEEEGPYLPPMAEPAAYRVDWIRNVPKGFEGHPQRASREYGETRNRAHAEKLAEVIRKIKAYDFATSP